MTRFTAAVIGLSIFSSTTLDTVSSLAHQSCVPRHYLAADLAFELILLSKGKGMTTRSGSDVRSLSALGAGNGGHIASSCLAAMAFAVRQHSIAIIIGAAHGQRNDMLNLPSFA